MTGEIFGKKPDAAVNKSKIKIVNRLLGTVRVVLADDEAMDFLDLLEEDDVPQASDVTLMLSQYVAAMNAFRERHYGFDGLNHKWFTE